MIGTLVKIKTDFDNVMIVYLKKMMMNQSLVRMWFLILIMMRILSVVSSKDYSSEFNENAVSDVELFLLKMTVLNSRKKMDYDHGNDVVSSEDNESEFKEDVVSDVEIIPIEDDGS